MSVDAVEINAGAAPDPACCFHEAGHLVAGLAAGRRLRDVAVCGGDGLVRWAERPPPGSPREHAAYHWVGLCTVVAGPVAELLHEEYEVHREFLPLPERAPRLAVAAMLDGWAAPDGAGDGDPGSVMLRYGPLVSGRVWRGEPGDFAAYDDVALARTYAGEWLRGPHPEGGGPAPVRGSPPRPLVDLIVRAEAAAERVLVRRWHRVCETAEALARRADHSLTASDVRAAWARPARELRKPPRELFRG